METRAGCQFLWSWSYRRLPWSYVSDLFLLFDILQLSHLSDSKKLFSAESFKPGSTHKCRIIDYSQMDELVLLSLRK